jgi:hypothetical protein
MYNSIISSEHQSTAVARACIQIATAPQQPSTQLLHAFSDVTPNLILNLAIYCHPVGGVCTHCATLFFIKQLAYIRWNNFRCSWWLCVVCCTSVYDCLMLVLQAADLRAELARLGADSSGTKEELAEKLLQVLKSSSAAAAAVTDVTAHSLNRSQAASSHDDEHHQRSSVANTQGAIEQLTAAAAAAVNVSGLEQAGATSADQHIQEIAEHDKPQSQLQHSPPGGHMQQQQHSTNAGSNTDSNFSAADSIDSAVSVCPITLDLDPTSPVQPGHMPPLIPAEAARVAAAMGLLLEDLPPMAPQCKGHVYDVKDMPGLTEAERELVLKVSCPQHQQH